MSNQQPPSTPSESSAGPTSPAQAPTLPRGPSQCLTPPSHRRREARIAYCQEVYAAAQAQTGETPEVVRNGYNSHEIDTRTVEWQDWEVPPDTTYEPVNAGRVLGPDGLVRTWEPGGPDWWIDGGEQFLHVPGLGQHANTAYRDFLDGIEAVPSTWEQLHGAAAAPPPPALVIGPSGQDAPSTGINLPNGALPIILGAIYIVARAMGIGPNAARRQQRREERAASEGKVAELTRRR